MKAQTKKLSLMLMMGVFAVITLMSIGCETTQMTPEQQKAYEDSLSQAKQDSLLKANRAKCEFKLSNGYEYYKQQNWEQAIANYEDVRDLGCGPSMAENLYLYLGNAYREVGNQDSAIAVFKEGREHMPHNVYILQNLAYMYKVTNQTDLQIEAQEALVEEDPENVEHLSEMATLYMDTNQYENAVNTYKKILSIDPNNSAAQSELITAMNEAGMNPMEALRERWDNNPQNSTYGLEYGEALFSNNEYEEAVDVFSKVTDIDPQNVRAWNQLARAHENLENYAQAIDAYKGLLNIDSNRKDIISDVAELYININNYTEALTWANRAINTGSNNGMGYAARGRIYEDAASECSGGNPSFEDKLVYQMAYDDFQTAVSMGYGQVTSRIEYLENFIPSKGDWFMQSDSATEVSPDKSCYSWIDRTIQRPSE